MVLTLILRNFKRSRPIECILKYVNLNRTNNTQINIKNTVFNKK